jgi:hypothetical protein
MSPEIILQHLVRRLESQVGSVSRADFAAWGDEEPAVLSMGPGKSHLAQALLWAREALESGDEEEIAQAALICPTLERTGIDVAAKARRKMGGIARGKAQTNEQERRWQVHRAKYRKLVAAGTHYLKARQEVLAGVDFEVDNRTIQKWLPKPAKVESN